MQVIDLEAVTSQDVTFVADGQQYELVIRANDDVMFMDVTINGVVVITACPCLVGQQVIPYAYLEGAGGNFIFTTASGANPQYANFGGADVLLYASNAEMASARSTNAANAATIVLSATQAG